MRKYEVLVAKHERKLVYQSSRPTIRVPHRFKSAEKISGAENTKIKKMAAHKSAHIYLQNVFCSCICIVLFLSGT